ncbi:hypothetical protein FRC12_014312 [Ceratobasidium sp. 428]|nr:hypothetical protein FRC12_014312 [Ceratobasidium sp. 428]
MDQPAAHRLPVEVFGLILGLVENLSSASLVSRQFHALTFPIAHHTVQLYYASRVKGFIDHVLAEDDSAPLRISQALRSLTVSEKYHEGAHCYSKALDDCLAIQFRTIIPKLVKLQHLTWSVPEPADLLVEFQRYCTQLRSLELSRRIHELNVDRFFNALGTSLFDLRHLELQMLAMLDWNPILDRAQESNPVRSFFMNNPKIETLVIDWVPESPINNPDLPLIRDMFPALRHFNGPQRISAILLASDVRLQLESLHILSFPKLELDAYATIRYAATELPQLRRLRFPADFVPPKGLKSGAESIFLDVVAQYEVVAHAALKHANLRELVTPLPWEFGLTETHDREMITLITRIAIACPRLQQLTDTGRKKWTTIHRFERDSQGRLTRILDSKGRVKYVIPPY